MTWLRRRFRKPAEPPIDTLEQRAGIGFGDTARVHVTPVTEAAGVAGRVGTVLGHTTRSLGYVADIIGSSPDDLAVNVAFDDGVSVWLTPDLVEFVDHQPGMEIGIAGVTYRRSANDEWEEAPRNPEPKAP
jgi:hypothetical protein